MAPIRNVGPGPINPQDIATKKYVDDRIDTRVEVNDPRLSDARTPLSHKHTVADLTTTGTASATTYLRGDGQWVTPTNTTYTAMTVAEGTTSLTTTVRAMRGDYLKQMINYYITGSVATSATTIGQNIAKAADGAAVRGLIGAGTSDLTIGNTSTTAKAGNYVPAWSEITDKPITFAPANHTHLWADITDKPTTFAPAAHSHDWNSITSKPTTFAPIIGTTAATAKAGNYVPTWTEVTSKPTTFAPIIGTTSTTAKAGNYVPTWSEITSKPTTFTPATHTHTVSDISNASVLGGSLLTAADPTEARLLIDAKSIDWVPTVGDISGLQDTLDAKANRAIGLLGSGIPWSKELVINGGALANGYNDMIGGAIVDFPIVLTGMTFRIGDPSKTIGGTGNLTIQWYASAENVLEETLINTTLIAAGQRSIFIILETPVNITNNMCLRAKITLGSTTVDSPVHVEWRGRYQ